MAPRGLPCPSCPVGSGVALDLLRRLLPSQGSTRALLGRHRAPPVGLQSGLEACARPATGERLRRPLSLSLDGDGGGAGEKAGGGPRRRYLGGGSPLLGTTSVAPRGSTRRESTRENEVEDSRCGPVPACSRPPQSFRIDPARSLVRGQGRGLQSGMDVESPSQRWTRGTRTRRNPILSHRARNTIRTSKRVPTNVCPLFSL